MLKDNVARPAPLNELISPTPLLLLAPGTAKLTGRGNWFARTLLHDAETSNGESLLSESELVS
jgi:hypothetical protein